MTDPTRPLPRHPLFGAAVVLGLAGCPAAGAPQEVDAAVDARPESAASPTEAAAPEGESAAPAESETGNQPDGATPTEAEAAAGDGLGRAINAFGFDLWQKVRSEPGNLSISPASVHVALTMTWAGARGETETEMREALHLDVLSQDMEVGRALGALVARWHDVDGLTLRVANRLFGEKTYTFESAYLTQLETQYKAPLEPVDFRGAAEASRKHINGWVEEQTESKIVDLIPPKGVDATTRLVLTNAIYFLADWKVAFNPELTADADFHAPKGDVQVPMMRRSGSMPYYEDTQIRATQLEYKAPGFVMTFVVPNEGVELSAVEATLNEKVADRWFTGLAAPTLRQTKVDLTVPRFRLEPPNSLALSAQLKEMGIAKAFVHATADFSGMAQPPDPNDRLSISEVFHKTFVQVDEKGTEAAAATAVAMARGAGAAPEPPKQVRLDRPFLFFIRDTTTGTVVFMGRVADPS